MAAKAETLFFEVDEGLNTLVDYRHRRKFSATDGEPGGKRRCHGGNGADIVLKVPRRNRHYGRCERKSHRRYVR